VPKAHFRLERAALKEGHAIVAGVDEAGRGPLAGPVVAAAVVLDPKRLPKGAADSKTLTPERRDALYDIIIATARVGVGVVDVATIDSVNILNATFLAMRQAVDRLASPPGLAPELAPDLAIVDGNRAPALACRVRTLVDGDALCLSIAAASIVAKVTRDRLMVALDAECPGYGFAAHKGYSTPEHLAALKALGASPHHRVSFAPVAERLGLTVARRRPLRDPDTPDLFA
jgi:ribonuclease HII